MEVQEEGWQPAHTRCLALPADHIQSCPDPRCHPHRAAQAAICCYERGITLLASAVYVRVSTTVLDLRALRQGHRVWGHQMAPAAGCTTSAPMRPPGGRRDAYVATRNALQCGTQHASRWHGMLYTSLHPTATGNTHSATGAVICSEIVRFALSARAIVLRVQLTSGDIVTLHQVLLGVACSGWPE